MDKREKSTIWAGFALVLLSALGASADWERVTAFDEDIYLRTVYFTDTLNGWVGGGIDTGAFDMATYMAHTSDGGVTWERTNIDSLSLRGIMDIHFISADVGWIAGWDQVSEGVLLHTTDGGASWQIVLDLFETILEIDFPTPQDGYFSTDYGTIGLTHDGGQTWEIRGARSDDHDPADHNDIQFLDKNTGFLVSRVRWGGGFFHRTDDAGEIWTRNDTFPALESVFFLDENRGWIGGDSGYIAATIDGGENWEVQKNYDTRYPIYDLHFVNDTVGWAMSHRTLFFTRDAGENWDMLDSSFSRWALNEMHFVGPNHGWVAGTEIFYRTTDNGGYPQTVSVNNRARRIPSSRLSLQAHQVRKGSVDLSFSMTRAAMVHANVFDLHGRKIQTLMDGYRNSGRQSCTFTGAAGTYIVEVRVGSGNATQTGRERIFVR